MEQKRSQEEKKQESLCVLSLVLVLTYTVLGKRDSAYRVAGTKMEETVMKVMSVKL